MQAKTVRGLLLVGVFVGLAVVRLRPITVAFAGKTLRVTVLVYCDLPTLESCAADLAAMRAEAPTGLAAAIKRFYEGEFQRVTSRTTRLEVRVVPPKVVGGLVVAPPGGLVASLGLYRRLMREFAARGESFWRADARLFVVIGKPVDPTSVPRESSIGSPQGRIGLVDWPSGASGANLAWNDLKTLHELGHIFGANDHYTPDGRSAFPAGFVEPDRGETSAQRYADVMSGTRPVGSGKPEATPQTLGEVRVSPTTAAELGWRK